MINQTKKNLFNLLSSSKFALVIVSGIFFFAWSRLVIDVGGGISFWALIGGGIIIPVILLVGAIQYNSRVAYTVTFTVFLITIFRNLSSLPYYLQEYNYEKLYGISDCSCCPKCEIKYILKLVFVCCFAIYLMSSNKILEKFEWKLSDSLKLTIFVLIIYVIINKF